MSKSSSNVWYVHLCTWGCGYSYMGQGGWIYLYQTSEENSTGNNFSEQMDNILSHMKLNCSHLIHLHIYRYTNDISNGQLLGTTSMAPTTLWTGSFFNFRRSSKNQFSRLCLDIGQNITYTKRTNNQMANVLWYNFAMTTTTMDEDRVKFTN